MTWSLIVSLLLLVAERAAALSAVSQVANLGEASLLAAAASEKRAVLLFHPEKTPWSMGNHVSLRATNWSPPFPANSRAFFAGNRVRVAALPRVAPRDDVSGDLAVFRGEVRSPGRGAVRSRRSRQFLARFPRFFVRIHRQATDKVAVVRRFHRDGLKRRERRGRRRARARLILATAGHCGMRGRPLATVSRPSTSV